MTNQNLPEGPPSVEVVERMTESPFCRQQDVGEEEGEEDDADVLCLSVERGKAERRWPSRHFSALLIIGS
jgi:hypothetical protein